MLIDMLVALSIPELDKHIKLLAMLLILLIHISMQLDKSMANLLKLSPTLLVLQSQLKPILHLKLLHMLHNLQHMQSVHPQFTQHLDILPIQLEQLNMQPQQDILLQDTEQDTEQDQLLEPSMPLKSLTQ